MSENVIEFITNEGRATVTFSQCRYKSRIRELAKKFPEECEIVAENADGSMCAHIPVAWVRINPPAQLTEEQRAERAERARNNLKAQWERNK